jgi:Flp pilus assembly protein TadG
MVEQSSAGLKSAKGGILRRLRAFGAAREGNIALWFALMLLPLLLAVGAAIDYARAATLRAKLQQATDAAILAVAPLASQKTDAELKTLAESYLQSAMKEAVDSLGGRDVHIDSMTVSADRGSVTITSAAAYDPVFMNIGAFRQQTITLGTLSQTVASSINYEIALVVDTSGSMNDPAGRGRNAPTKISATKTAAKDLIDAMFSTPQAQAWTKISLVPFSLSVRVVDGFDDQWWIDQYGQSSIHWPSNMFEKPVDPHSKSRTWPPQSRLDLFDELSDVNKNMKWAGCFEMRPGDLGITDSPPIASTTEESTEVNDTLFVPQFWPDEPDTTGYINNYINDNTAADCKNKKTTGGAAAQVKLCKYHNPTKVSGNGPNYLCNSQVLTRLSNDPDALKANIDKLNATGGTNLVEGLMWGWRTLSPNAPFSNGSDYDNRKVRKILIFMTDGVNQWLGGGDVSSLDHNKSYYTPFGYYANDRIKEGITSSTGARIAMDNKTLQACTNAKDAGITIYTVGFDTGSDIDDSGRDLLKDCASYDASGSQKLTYIATNSDDIVQIFNDIAHQLGALRLAK